MRGSMGTGNVQFINGQPNVANLADLTGFQVIWNQWELLTQTLYDSIAYPAAGLNSASFFSIPIGQGVGFGGGAKTRSDTNLQLAGQLPAGNMFICSSVEVSFQPATPTVAAGMPAAFGAQAVATSINDAYIVGRSGNLNLTILSKPYIQDAPIGKFPPTADFTLNAALSDGTTLAASSQSRIGYAGWEGLTYVLTPNNLLIPSSTNFSVTLAWPEGLQVITNPARIFVRMNGMLARKSQ